MEEIKNTKRIRVKTLQAMYVFTSFKKKVCSILNRYENSHEDTKAPESDHKNTDCKKYNLQ